MTIKLCKEMNQNFHLLLSENFLPEQFSLAAHYFISILNNPKGETI